MNRLSRYKYLRSLGTTVSGKLLYLILSDISDAEGTVIITQRRLSEATGLCRQTVSRNLRRLRDGGYIRISPRYHEDGGRAANEYYVL